MAGLYVHIPFCVSRCIYCGFYSTVGIDKRDEYLDALQKEIEIRNEYMNEDINTIYIGGGTPSALSNKQLERLFRIIGKFVEEKNKCRITENKEFEFTIECNPNDLNDEKIDLLRESLVNRVSMGVQTFDDSRLKFIKRRHNSAQAKEVFRKLRKAGFGNISIDLMFGFPNQTIDEWGKDIDEAIGLQPEHLSVYSLMIEDDTPLYNLVAAGKVKEIDEEESLAMYKLLCKKMEENGYEHYEISNFAKHGCHSRHNSSYWRDIPYMGIGAAAHSYDGHSRQWNISDLNKYIDGIGKGKVSFEREIIDETTHFNDIITTATRTAEGISLEKIKREFGEKYLNNLMNEAKKHIANGMLEIADDNLRLTKEGVFISDYIMSDLIYI
ncbi:MAG: radical SAM family heme chaperone HemW [Prevotella sp.]|nr:radical SAM family heme chaperone HemW [Prevotella sp.]